MIKNKKVLDLLRQIQGLAIQTPKIIMYYQEDVSLFSIYSFREDGNYAYKKQTYIDGAIYGEEQTILDLENILKDMEEMNK